LGKGVKNEVSEGSITLTRDGPRKQLMRKRLGSPYVSGRSRHWIKRRHWIKSKKPNAPAIKRGKGGLLIAIPKGLLERLETARVRHQGHALYRAVKLAARLRSQQNPSCRG
jgi:hypothetical protein